MLLRGAPHDRVQGIQVQILHCGMPAAPLSVHHYGNVCITGIQLCQLSSVNIDVNPEHDFLPDRIELPAGATHQIVRDYLVHYGYADTLAAFDSAAGVIPGSQDDDMGKASCVGLPGPLSNSNLTPTKL